MGQQAAITNAHVDKLAKRDSGGWSSEQLNDRISIETVNYQGGQSQLNASGSENSQCSVSNYRSTVRGSADWWPSGAVDQTLHHRRGQHMLKGAHT